MQNHINIKLDYYLYQISSIKKISLKTITKDQSNKLDSFQKMFKLIKKQVKDFKINDLQAFNIYQSIFEEFQALQRKIILQFRLQKTDFQALIVKQKIKEQALSKVNFTKMEDKILTSSNLSNIDLQMQSFTLKALCQKSSSIMINLPYSAIQTQIQFSKGALKFIFQICKNYNIVPYHNFTHAFSVFIFFYQCSQMQNLKPWIDDFQLFFGLIACLCHDLRHPGNNTLFEVKTKSNLAITYHNCSIMQKMHTSRTINLLERQFTDKQNPYLCLSKEDKSRARRIITKCILATDMSKHYDYVKDLNDTQKMMKLNSQKGEDRQFFMECLIHACDVGNPCMFYQNYIYWANLICMEFNNQTKLQQFYGVQVTQFLKFNSLTYFYKNQLTFTSNVVAPLWEGISTKYPQLQEFYLRIKDNIKKVNQNLRRNSQPPLNVFERYLNQRISKLA